MNKILNSLSFSIEFPRLLALSDQPNIRNDAIKRMARALDEYIVLGLKMETKTFFNGVIPILSTPFDEQGKINFRDLT